MGKVLNPVTLGPVDKKEAERLAKAYQAEGYKTEVKERAGRADQYMVECTRPD